MYRSELARWVAMVTLILPFAPVGYSNDVASRELGQRGDMSQSRGSQESREEAAERAPGAGAGAPTTAGPEHASEVELDSDADDDLPAPAGSGGGETHGRRDYGGARGSNSSPYDTPGANPSTIYD